ncbi:TRAP transporter small permease subunit [Azoarcus communis]|uniref:TRAP transporter small permease protein n=1 Tax=Parazoarcus communis SWub3 = DSM 12120 TaxID=1121029 RepID=A0A323UV24_9RHOO|nr:TRAP transporter small permease [Parazoarcus communis]NMG50802.1 TRAP transporter small permease subunit [Parazoarcus communis]NMG72677.1 TRAP transporter small permease subunit [Parazoarcus communis SWub3 = DSM 12120]PZA15853.1 TRAP transporter small permease [Azoarcus communis] [Parazoarcus communis SWub3 = DSM 12120]
MAEAMDKPTAPPSGPIGRIIEWACMLMAMLAGLMFIIEAVMSVASVIGRAAFSMPVPGDYELVQMLSAMGIAMCLPYCQLKKGHVFVDFFTLWAPPGLKRALDAVAALLLAFSSFVLAWRIWEGLLEMREYGETSMVISLPVWWGYVPVVPAFVLLGIAALYTFMGELRKEAGQ